MSRIKAGVALLGLGIILFSLFVVPAPGVARASDAVETPYTLLAPLPLDTPKGPDVTSTTASQYIIGIVRLVIAVAGGLAVLRITFAGFQYISTDSFSGKDSAKQGIQEALYGLILIIAAYTILYTINPQLVKFDLKIAGQEGTALPTKVGDTPTEGDGTGAKWDSDEGARTLFKDLNIGVNNQSCTVVGQQNCTSLFGLSQAVYNGLKKLKADCNCTVTITGGTEYWLHGNRSADMSQNPTPHKPGGTVVDLRLSDQALHDFLKAKGTIPTGADATRCTPGTERYLYGGGLYVNETIEGNADHWHVCYN